MIFLFKWSYLRFALLNSHLNVSLDLLAEVPGSHWPIYVFAAFFEKARVGFFSLIIIVIASHYRKFKN